MRVEATRFLIRTRSLYLIVGDADVIRIIKERGSFCPILRLYYFVRGAVHCGGRDICRVSSVGAQRPDKVARVLLLDEGWIAEQRVES